MASIRFFTDEDVYSAIATQLQAAGFDAVSTPGGNRLGALDVCQLAWAAQEDRALVTFNVAHFAQLHYVLDFLIRLKHEGSVHLILETKGYDPLTEVKAQAAQRWVAAVNADGSYGSWHYAVARKPEEVAKCIEETTVKSHL